MNDIHDAQYYAERVQGWADGLALTHPFATLRKHPAPCNGLDFCVAKALQEGIAILLRERDVLRSTGGHE